MRVLQIGMSYNPGGVESFVMNYYRQVVKQNIQFDFICMYESIAYESEIKELGGNVYYVTDVKKNPYALFCELSEILRNKDYCAVHINMLSAANIVPLLVCHKMNMPKIIAHSHNSDSPGILKNVMHRVNKHLLPYYTTDFFACSEVAGKWLFTRKVLKSDRYHIIHNALDVRNFLYSDEVRKVTRKELHIEDKFVIGHVGRFEEQKNHIFLLEVFREVVEVRQDAVLLLIGEGELKEQIQAKAICFGLESRVQFLGVRSDMNRLWNAMDLFVLPSLFEGLPLVALEAQASGVYSLIADTVTQDVKITDHVDFLPLEGGAVYWKERILACLDYKRDLKYNNIICTQFSSAGYDIESAAERLVEYYKN